MAAVGALGKWFAANRLLVIAMTVALTGVLLLYAYAATAPPVTLEIGGIDEGRIGELVSVEGFVKKISNNSGGTNLLLGDAAGNHTVKVFIAASLWEDMDTGSIAPGSKLRVRGIVDEFGGELEIVVKSASGVTVLEPGT